MTTVGSWARDLVLGIRLSVGGGRTSWARLALGTVGIGLAAAVLLVAASVNHILANQQARAAANATDSTPIAGVAPLDLFFGSTRFHGVEIDGSYVHATGPTSPVPPGVSRLPGPNEIVLSPALARLLDSPDGALLRPRFPERVIGEIAEGGLGGPQDLTFYAGVPPGETVQPQQQVYSFGSHHEPTPLGSVALRALLVVGVVALLVPILIMVAVSTRIAAAARDRRLAALRLVGAGSAQVRRIAAAETLVPSASGLALGAALYAVFRQVAPSARLAGVSVFTDDVTVSWPLVVLIVLVVPLLAVASALAALRRTVIEPLGVVRGGRPGRRRVWWRVGLVAVGIVLLLGAGPLRTAGTLWVGLVGVGAGLLLIGLPVLLPFLVERGVGVLRGGTPSWQLAIRRLQLDSGTPARVVAGVAVVLAGAIALQTVLSATAFRLAVPDLPDAQPGAYYVLSDSAIAGQVTASIRRTGVARGVYPATMVGAGPAGGPKDTARIMVASCATIEQYAHVPHCRDGDVFGAFRNRFTPRTRLTLTGNFDGNRSGRGHDWTVPASVRPVPPTGLGAGFGPSAQLLVTPRALGRTPVPADTESWTLVRLHPNRPDDIERVRNAVAAHPLRVAVESVGLPVTLTQDQQTYAQIRTALLIGSLFTLTMAGVSLLVLALEQLRERRRPLAMLSAAGVPRAVLARSLLWQIAVPVGVGVLAAIGTGLLLAELVLYITGTRLTLDWADVGVFSGSAVVLVLVVVAATLPALRAATRLAALRTE